MAREDLILIAVLALALLLAAADLARLERGAEPSASQAAASLEHVASGFPAVP